MSALCTSSPQACASADPKTPDSGSDQAPSLADLRGPALSCLLALRVAAGPAKADWLRQTSGFGRDALWNGLHILVRFGLARYDARSRAWMLTGAGADFLCSFSWLADSENCIPENPAAIQLPSASLPENPGAASSGSADRLTENPAAIQLPSASLPENPGAASSGSADRLTENPAATQLPSASLPENPGAAHGFGVNQGCDDGPLKDLREIESKPLPDSSLSQGLDSSGHAAAPEELPEIQPEAVGLDNLDVGCLLRFTGDLFGEPLLGSPSSYQEPRRLLAVIAETYHNRHQLHKPARAAYQAYKNGRQPPAAYWQDPSQFLPAEYLDRAGLPPPDKYRGWQTAQETDPPQDPSGRDHLWSAADRSLPSGALIPKISPASGLTFPPGPAECCAPGVAPEQAERWYRSLVLLSSQTELAVFRRYLVDLVLVECDLGTGHFTIGCRDVYHQAWLEGRLQALLQRLMVGVWKMTVRVSFIVWPETGDA